MQSFFKSNSHLKHSKFVIYPTHNSQFYLLLWSLLLVLLNVNVAFFLFKEEIREASFAHHMRVMNNIIWESAWRSPTDGQSIVALSDCLNRLQDIVNLPPGEFSHLLEREQGIFIYLFIIILQN